MATLQICLSLLAVLLASTPTSALKPYELVKTLMTWQEASNYCKQNGINGLLNFDSETSWEALSELMFRKGVLEGRQIWLDLTNIKNAPASEFYFAASEVDLDIRFGGSTPQNEENVLWYPGEPNNNGGKENCVLARMVNRRLRLQDYDCNNQNQKFWFACNEYYLNFDIVPV